ncbi:MAG TPA: hypothetical protein VF679_13375 [Pedobacter sp.]
MSDINIQDLRRRWVHSFEEDTDDAIVYRPENFDFPMARGRVSMELKDNGALKGFQIGRNDIPAPDTGSWELEGERLLIKYPNQEDGQTFLIKEASDEKLVLKTYQESKRNP